MIDSILGSNTGKIIHTGREFGVEPHIDSERLIVEFQVPEHRHFRPNVSHIEHLAPAMVPDNDIRLVAQQFQIGRHTTGRIRAPNGSIQFPSRDMRFRGGR